MAFSIKMPNQDTERELLKESAQYFFAGCDSYTLPRALGLNEFIASMNTVCRGGIIQTRPGTDSLYSIPGANLQGFKIFTPSFGATHHVIAVDGYIYASPAPFRTYRLLPNIRFNPSSKYVVFEECLQSTEYTIEGELVPLSRPRKILMIQDGRTRAAFWDGGTSRHLNPTPSTGPLTVEGLDETLIGLFMKWSNNRLWIEHNGKIQASDLGNPLKFKDAQVLNEGRAFFLSSDCTGMVETPDQKGLIVFTRNNGSLFQTHIADRTTWFQTNDFQSIIFPKVGCASPRSITVQYGLIWWFSSHGLINSDQALSSNRTSRMDYQDNEMICSKGNMGPDLSMICGASFENYLLMSVPSGDILNRHTWCLDQAVFEGPLNAWNSYWTGWNPVEWSVGEVDGEERIFFASHDVGGCLRIWEAMKPHRTDNGQPITCFAQFREHDFGDQKALKKFHNAEFYCHEILGDVSWMSCVASTKGSFYRIGGSELVATPGGVFFDELYDRNTCMYGHRPQTRTLRTTADAKLNDCNEGGVESDFPNDLDHAFSLLLVWSGRFGCSGYTIFAQVDEDSPDGDCTVDEVGYHSLSEQGCSAREKFVNTCTFPKFVSSQVSTVPCDRAGNPIQAMADASSIISQADADRKAKGAAMLKALSLCQCAPEVFWNTEQSFTAFCPDGQEGESVTRRIRAKQVFSYKSQDDADTQALLQARALAEAGLVCSPIPPQNQFLVDLTNSNLVNFSPEFCHINVFGVLDGGVSMSLILEIPKSEFNTIKDITSQVVNHASFLLFDGFVMSIVEETGPQEGGQGFTFPFVSGTGPFTENYFSGWSGVIQPDINSWGMFAENLLDASITFQPYGIPPG